MLESNIISYYHIINFISAFVEIQTDFVPIDSSDMNISVQSDQANVVSAAKKLKEEFEDLLLLVKRSVSDIDLENFRLRLTWSLSSKKQNTPAVQEHLDNLEKLSTAPAVLNYLISRNFIGYLNYELLKVFQKEVQSDELQSSIKQYEQNYDAFLRLANFSTIVDTIKQHDELAPASPIGLPEFTVRLESPWENKSVFSWKELLYKKFKWPNHINIVAISRNCIIVTYSVLPFFAPAVVRDLTNQEVLALLKYQGVRIELSPDLLKLGEEVEVEVCMEKNMQDSYNVPTSNKSDAELTSSSEQDGDSDIESYSEDGEETSDEEVPVKSKTLSTPEKVQVITLLLCM